jgi:hypothetical protein
MKEAVESEGQISADRVEALERLARLVNLQGTITKSSPARKRWPIALALGSTLLIVSLMLFARVDETEIEMVLAVSEVSFLLPDKQVLTDLTDVSTLGASGLSEIQIPRDHNQDGRTVSSSNGGEPGLRLSVDTEKRQGTITLEPVLVPALTHVWIRHLDSPQHLRLSLKGMTTELQVSVNGPVQLALTSGESQQLDFVSPQAFRLQTGTKVADLDVTLNEPKPKLFTSQLSVSDLSFFHIDEFRDPANTVLRRTSTIQSGTLSYTSLNDLERQLRPGEMVHFEQIQGEFRALRLKDDGLELKFHGRVRGMSVGSEQNRRSVMPTWLDWLRARHSLSLLWGTTLYLFGLVGALLRWWGKPS